jgi:trehalose/maltose hydrolase-like predicted phosphorylase
MEKIKISEKSIHTDIISEDGFNESIFFTGNGYMGARGYISEKNYPNKSYKGIFIAGIFDNLSGNITDMVNCADLFEHLITVDGISLDKFNIKDFNINLNLNNGELSYKYKAELNNKYLFITYNRFFSYDDIHLACSKLTLSKMNFKGKIKAEFNLNGESINNPINDDQVKENNIQLSYLKTLNTGFNDNIAEVLTRTKTTGLNVCYMKNTDFINKPSSCLFEEKTTPISAIQTFNFDTEINGEYTFESKNIVYTSRDCNDVKSYCNNNIKKYLNSNYDLMLTSSTKVWDNVWKDSYIYVDNEEILGALNYSIYQLIVNNSKYDNKVSIGARGLTHSRYKGCYFWDTDIFMLPYYVLTNPLAAKNLLLYRYNNLDNARLYAKNNNCTGARYPWMASYSGLEQCETWDIGSCEIHVTADVGYSVYNYIKWTNDTDFLYNMGAEIYIEIARFFISRLSYDSKSDSYNMMFVKGPDEYCGSTINNTYTNYLARFLVNKAIETVDKMKKICPDKYKILTQKTGFNKKEYDYFKDMSSKFKILYDLDNKLFIQDETFDKLEEVNIQNLKMNNNASYKYINFDKLQRMKVLKQADILLLMELFSEDFTLEQKIKAFDYYEPLTMHDSTLSYCTHGQSACKIDRKEKISEYMYKSLFLDLKDIMNNTGNEGLHLAAIGGSWQMFIFGIAGLYIENESLKLNPRLPKEITKLSFNICYQNKRYMVKIDSNNSFSIT